MVREFIKYIGPGLLITVGFIDPGNWASNVAAGSEYGYRLLWMVTISTLMLIVLQHTAARLGIITGKSLSEAATSYTKPLISKLILISAYIASISTALAEILGGAIALNMLFAIPIKLAAVLIATFSLFMIWTNSYNKIEKWIICFVSIIGFCFIFELALVDVEWGKALFSWTIPSIPKGSMPVIMSVLGAVVMPHNLFLHSEIIQNKHFDRTNETNLIRQIRFEFLDTLFSMIIGWGINSAMIIVAAATFYKNGILVKELQQAQILLKPILGGLASLVFALALLFSGISSSITAGISGGVIYSGIYNKTYDIKDKETKIGIAMTLICALLIIMLISDTFKGLLISQIVLSIQLPFTIFLLIFLTSSQYVMGEFKNDLITNVLLWIIGIVVTVLNVLLLIKQ
ncbi:MAG: Nramp family divalent metal transporter [Caloramator sp.]|nr:Nramp family divalent metal transporter [Caloramator sp.]